MKAIKRNVALLAAMGLMAGSGAVWAAQATDTFTATATLQAGLTVDCNSASLNFGTISRPTTNYSGDQKVTIAATDAGAVTVGSQLATSATGPASIACTITNETGSNATAALSGGGGTWDNVDTLEGAVLTRTEGGLQTLLADLTLSKVSAIAADNILYIGGELTVKNSTDAPNSTYTSDTITLTVTE